jgi:hypothetical protein
MNIVRDIYIIIIILAEGIDAIAMDIPYVVYLLKVMYASYVPFSIQYLVFLQKKV